MLYTRTLVCLLAVLLGISQAFGQSCPKCRVDCDCYDHTLCVGGQCVAPSGITQCSLNSDCPSTKTCRNGVCLKKGGQACSNSAECDSNVCSVYGSCLSSAGKACTVDANCPYGFACDTISLTCKGAAGIKCRCNSDCLAGYCDNDLTCGVPLDGYCVNDNACNVGLKCHPLTNTCKGVANYNCAGLGREVCFIRECSVYGYCGSIPGTTCIADSNCPYSFKCVSGICLAPAGYGCRSNSDCAGGVCDVASGTCGLPLGTAGCTVDLNCNNGLVCSSSNVCLGGTSYKCQSGSQCASGKCIYNFCSN